MAIAIDPSTPAYAGGSSDPWVTASFTPPVDSLIVLVVTSDCIGALPTITPTSSGLTFTSQVRTTTAGSNGHVQIFTAPVLGANGGVARTISCTTSKTGTNEDSGAIKGYVLTGADLTNPVHLSAQAGPITGGETIQVNLGTATVPGCWGFYGAVDWNSNNDLSGVNGEFYDDADLTCTVARSSSAYGAPAAINSSFDGLFGADQNLIAAGVAIQPAGAGPPPDAGDYLFLEDGTVLMLESTGGLLLE